MTLKLTPSQALLLFAMIARHGECRQAELVPAVKKTDRDTLVAAKLMAWEKRGRGLYLSLTDTGWEWAGTHLDAELPPPHRTLSELLRRFRDHLQKSGQTLADVIGSKPETAKRKVMPPKPRTPAALRKRIETAYLIITGQKKNQSVKLSRLRAELADLDRATVDGALRRILAGDKKAALMRHDDPGQLDRSDHEAAFCPAGEPFHVLWIAS